MSKTFSIATWNVNSLRVRLPLVLRWLALRQPDVLALQETKVEDTDFPTELLHKAGYYTLYSGQKTYNGVAFVVREPIASAINTLPNVNDEQRRFLVIDAGPLSIVNVYVPNGAQLDSDKYAYKLRWLQALQHYLQDSLLHNQNMIVLGDFNIAPEDIDVYDPSAWQDQILVSPQERHQFRQILNLGFKDSFRLFDQAVGQYSWWDYRSASFRRNHGLRIDHILSSDCLATRCISCQIDKEPRTWERPSDHTPVIATYQFIHPG